MFCRGYSSVTMTLVNGTEKESGAQNGFTPHPEQTGDVEVVEDIHVADDALIYGVTDNPPIHLTVLFAFQVRLCTTLCDKVNQ